MDQGYPSSVYRLDFAAGTITDVTAEAQDTVVMWAVAQEVKQAVTDLKALIIAADKRRAEIQAKQVTK